LEDYGEIMARGLPDDSNVVKEAPVYGLSDMAELAARLGSPVNYIRFGDVVMLDDFESGVQAWDSVLHGGASSIRLSGTYTRSKGVSVHLDSGDGASPDASMQRSMPIPESSKVGFGFAFMIGPDVTHIDMGMVATINELNYAFYVGYENASHDLEVLDNIGGWMPIGNLHLRENLWPFHVCKLVVNLTAKNYARFYLDDQSYQIPGYWGDISAAPGEANLLNMVVAVYGDGTTPGHLYVDDCVATQNEF